MATSLAAKASVVALVSIVLSFLFGPEVHRTVTVMGVFRTPASTVLASTHDIVSIEGTTYCEDLHYHDPSHSLFTACQGSNLTTHSWWPPVAIFDDVTAVQHARGALYVIDANTQKAQKLEFENFDAPLVTHGIDVISDPDLLEREAVYIFAVNHLPNPDYYGPYPYDSESLRNFLAQARGNKQILKARSQIEIFHHTIGSSTARHLRTIHDPLIQTPNDILALSPTEFLVTNDHRHTEGRMRVIEDVWPGANWGSVVHVQLSSLEAPQEDVSVEIALDKLRNTNGLGHSRSEDEFMLTSCMSGILHIANVHSTTKENHHSHTEIHLLESLQFDSVVDNPSYFHDPYANSSYDASGFVASGIPRPIDLLKNMRDPTAKDGAMVWLAKPSVQSSVGGSGEVSPSTHDWEKQLLFEDDGSRIRSASAAVLVAIDPHEEEGKRRAWLYVTGFMAKKIVAVKVDI
ncbi:serum paraoxonase/arylesterase family protein [Pseudomassariella vexata]|uniref:Serum paraoxonase/arylesterase family protein n=1 Tax=Pseudomassariella vexata TaxID=1141098 RepID=A0A1Y2D7R3_9PEZI|nr:serum paraoxonase/arylesterase family protein [Pseudomassariella vexata]ORY55247.1 serum paraoxonase/arylesterase family protein [Pseudomassariella vexata]